MSTTFFNNYLHIIFSTKNRKDYLKGDIEVKTYRYIAKLCHDLESPPIIVGGYVDHVHILCLISKNIKPTEFISKIKSNSSRWIKKEGSNLTEFSWQRGYGAFSVSPDNVENVKSYIANQREHHKKRSFKEEFRAILEKYNIEYNDRYIWD